jgi:ankyrin repeat protein
MKHHCTLRELLKYGASVNVANTNGYTPLHLAGKGHLEAVTELLNHEASVDFTINECYIPLFVAAQNGHMEVVLTAAESRS